jgi:hypothetical protein
VSRIKVLFRALRITKPHEARAFIVNRFKDLVVFARQHRGLGPDMKEAAN